MHISNPFHIFLKHTFVLFFTGEASNPTSSSSLTTSIAVFLDNHCSPMYSRHLYWNWTRAGDVAIQPCPSKSTGLARWTCDSKTLSFTENQPDMSDCKSSAVTDLETRVREQDPENVIASGRNFLTDSLFRNKGFALNEIELLQRNASKFVVFCIIF